MDVQLTKAEVAADATTQLEKKMRLLTTEEGLPKSLPKGKLEVPRQQNASGQFVGEENMVTTSSTSSSSVSASRKGSSDPESHSTMRTHRWMNPMSEGNHCVDDNDGIQLVQLKFISGVSHSVFVEAFHAGRMGRRIQQRHVCLVSISS